MHSHSFVSKGLATGQPFRFSPTRAPGRLRDSVTRGFSLVELMIVVAIIAILSAIAILFYQNFTIRSQVSAGLSDLRVGMTAFEEAVVARDLTVFSHADIGLSFATARCEPIGIDPGPDGYVSCTLNGHPAIRGGVIELSRNSEDGWSCHISGIDERFFPEGCE